MMGAHTGRRSRLTDHEAMAMQRNTSLVLNKTRAEDIVHYQEFLRQLLELKKELEQTKRENRSLRSQIVERT